MKSILNNKNTLIIKNSKFICLTYQIHKTDEINRILNEVKEKYPNATHYCYAYIIDGISKESDDGEPSGTAGMPILQVLNKNNLDHVLCIVVRYFGKIKLGANGLIRAYSHSVKECIAEHIVELEKGFIINISFPYSLLKKIDHLLPETCLIKKEFNEIVFYQAIVNQNLLNELKILNVKIDIIDEAFIAC